MNGEFQKTGRVISSSKGFTVELKIAGGIVYSDANGPKNISSEWMAKPPGIILYKGARGNKGFENMKQLEIDSIFLNVKKALENFDYKVEIWSSPSGPDK
jgi:hypothetical protein